MRLPKNYNRMTIPERREARDEYVRRQGGKCSHCECPLMEDPAAHIMAARITPGLFPPNMFKFPVHLHHNHDTGMTIGAVHARCNAYLWEHHGE